MATATSDRTVTLCGAARAVGTLATALVMTACTGLPTPSGESGGDGPLVLPDEFSGVMAPIGKATFFTIDGCAGPDTTEPVEVLGVTGVEPWSDVDLVWKVAWPAPGDPVLPGSDVGTAPDAFESLPSSGTAAACADGESGPVLAVEFPRATTEHIGFESLEVKYRVGTREFTTTYETRVGICAKAVPGPPAACDS